MIRSMVMGAVAGQRAMTPLAAVAVAAARDELPRDNGAPKVIGARLVATGAVAIAVAEMVGDKWRKAPDRIVMSGQAARIATGAIAGAALAPREQRTWAALAGAATTVAASQIGWRLRCAAMRRWGQARTGFVEDALVLASAVAIVRGGVSKPR